MAKKNFLLLSLEDKKAKQVANVVGNASCKKILDFLAENEGTESEISKKLKIPLSTVHYNLGQLMDAGLIDADEYHYSEKGKEVYHYKLANKYIVIAPKSEKSSLREKLKGILPVGLIALGAAFIIQFVNKFTSKEVIATESFGASATAKRAAVPEAMIVQESADESAVAEPTAADSVAATDSEVTESAEIVNADTLESAPAPDFDGVIQGIDVAEPVMKTVSVFPENIALWFFIGVVFTLILVFFISFRRK